MNRKTNPLVSLIALLVLILIIVTVCAGCIVRAEAEETTEETPNYERFTVEFYQYGRIITDTETGVQYFAYTTPYGTGLTRLEGAEDGN